MDFARDYSGGETVFVGDERLKTRKGLRLDLPQLQTIRAKSVCNLTQPRKVVIRSGVQ